MHVPFVSSQTERISRVYNPSSVRAVVKSRAKILGRFSREPIAITLASAAPVHRLLLERIDGREKSAGNAHAIN